MKREFFITDDGSTSIHLPEWNEQYHSKHGAIQEAYHVFIKNGLEYLINKSEIHILEIGFGTGLNTLITLIESFKKNQIIHYTGVEKYPLNLDEIKQLNYTESLNAKNYASLFKQIHESNWEEKIKLNKTFYLTKVKKDFKDLTYVNQFDLIYFDAFGARVQPELWTESIFNKMFASLKKNGVLVTYSAKGSVRRNMIKVGFSVEKLEGPKGKREMLRGLK